MAGLLDNSTDLTSLLSQFQPTQGDMENARRQAQMQFFLGLLGAPKGGEFQRVGQSGLLAMQGYNDALANQQKALMERMQAAGMAMNIREQQQKFADLDAQRQAMGSIVSPQGMPQPGTLTGAATQASTGTPSLYERLNAIADQLEAQAAKLKSPAVAQMAMKYREEAAKYAPKYKGMETVMQDGKPVLLQTFDNQAPQPMQGFQPKPDYKSVDTGSQVGFYDPLTGQQSGTFTKSMTPGEAARLPIEQGQLAVSQGNLGVAQGRLGEEQRHNAATEGLAQAKQSRADEALANQKRGQLDMADRVLGMIDKATPQIKSGTTGLPGALVGKVPGTTAYDLRATVESIKSNLGFEQLQAMRNASPTGGALGQVSDMENKLLASTVANLDANQSEAQLRANLAEVRKHLANVKTLMQQAGNAPTPTAPAPSGNRTVIRTGVEKTTGRRVVQYSDGTTSYAQ